MSFITNILSRLKVRGLKPKPLIPVKPEPIAEVNRPEVPYRQPRKVRDKRRAQRRARKIERRHRRGKRE